MSDYKDLIERLRLIKDTLHWKAADALEAKDNQIAELEKNRDGWMAEAQHQIRLGFKQDARIAELEAALKDCADELEAWIDEAYVKSDGNVFPQHQFKYERDIATVRNARKALEKGDE